MAVRWAHNPKVVGSTPTSATTKNKMAYYSNIYYHPENCGLTIFDQIDTDRDYGFDMFIIFLKEDDTLWWATDSGCSCPTPFENINENDLSPITLNNFDNFDSALKSHRNISIDEYMEMSNRARQYLKEKNS